MLLLLCGKQAIYEESVQSKRGYKILEGLGWYIDRQNGTSHRQFKHPTIRSTVTVNGKLSDDIWIKNLKSIEKQDGIRFRDFAE